MNSQIKEMHRAKYVGRGMELPCHLCSHHPPGSFESSVCIPDTSPLSNTLFGNIYSQSVAGLLIPLSVFFKEQKFLILVKYNLSDFSFIDYTFVVLSNPV
jgi:hypothetical protein